MSLFRDSAYKIGGFGATVYDRVHDAASDCLVQFRLCLDDEIDVGGYCIDRPWLAPAGSSVYTPINHYSHAAVIDAPPTDCYVFAVMARDVYLHRSEGAPATFHHTTYDVVRDDGKVVRSGLYAASADAVASSLTQARYPRKVAA